jgi:hypothetical protein
MEKKLTDSCWYTNEVNWCNFKLEKFFFFLYQLLYEGSWHTFEEKTDLLLILQYESNNKYNKTLGQPNMIYFYLYDNIASNKLKTILQVTI